jgi:hypothetical protein
MGAKLPQAIDMQGPNGAVTQGSAVDFRSLEQAFEGAGRELEKFDESRKKADDDIAVRELEAAQGTYQGGAIERATMYDGRQPGFAAGELEAYDATIGPLLAREDLPDGVRDRLTLRSRDLRVRVGAQAVATEARARGARSAADRDAAEQAEAYKAVMAFNAIFDGLEDARRQEWDGATPGLAEGLRGDFALAREKVLEGLPAAVAERVRPLLQSREVTLQATAMAQEDEARDAGVLRTVSDGVTVLANRASRDPSVLARWDEEFAPIRSMLPAHLRAAAEKEAKQDVFGRALETRIDAGDFETVRSEIAAGRYDWMDPGVVSRLGSAIETADAVRTVEDAQAEADLAAEIDVDLRNILEGKPSDAGLIARAEALGGPDLAAKVRTDQAAALNVRPLMGRLRTMTSAELTGELERLTAASGDAVGARTLELARGLIEQNQTLKGGDPAAWTATAVGPGDRVANEVRARLTAFESAPTAESAQAYARATWTAQQASGVGQQQRRILPSATAEAWVEGLDADGAPATALPDLAQRLALFGPGFRPQVIRELGLAGLKPADLGALTHYANNPARLAQYVRSRGQPLNQLVEDKDQRAAIDTALGGALAPYNAALASGQGSEATREAARATAYGLVARGVAVRDAVRSATAPMTDGWAFEGSWAIPTDGRVSEDRVRGNARVLFSNLTANRGAGLYAPPSDRYSPEQSRRNYLDIVREHGQWRNLSDGTGVELVTPAAGGRGWVRVRDAAGRDVVKTWRELETYR